MSSYLLADRLSSEAVVSIKRAEENAASEIEAAKKEAAAKSASKSVKTGDASIVAFSVFGFIAFVSAAILVFMKKNRKDFEK